MVLSPSIQYACVYIVCCTLLCDFAYDFEIIVNISFFLLHETKNVPFHFMEYVLLDMGNGST
jgi:hypothetical protein